MILIPDKNKLEHHNTDATVKSDIDEDIDDIPENDKEDKTIENDIDHAVLNEDDYDNKLNGFF